MKNLAKITTTWQRQLQSIVQRLKHYLALTL
nr:MAG TPA: hypothetical protein [Caudoviricetes sp.]